MKKSNKNYWVVRNAGLTLEKNFKLLSFFLINQLIKCF